MGQLTTHLVEQLGHHGQRSGIVFHYHCQALANRLENLHPATGGYVGLVHNWGNPESRAALASARAKWAKYMAYRNAVYSQIMKGACHAQN